MRWTLSHRCEANRATLVCYVTQTVRGGNDVSGNCVGDGLGPDPPSFHVGASTNRPDDVGFEMVGALQGRVCVRGTVFLSNGRTLDMPARWWDVTYCGGGRIPEILWWLRRPDGATESSLAYGTLSGEGCPVP